MLKNKKCFAIIVMSIVNTRLVVKLTILLGYSVSPYTIDIGLYEEKRKNTSKKAQLNDSDLCL